MNGKNWTGKNVDGVYLVSIADHSSIVEALTDFVISQSVTAGQITGIGAVNKATLRYYNPSTKKYLDKIFEEQMEIANLSGNIFMLEGKVVLHLHITLGRKDYSAIAGHLLDANIRGAGEFFVYPIPTLALKKNDENTGLNLYEF